MTNYEKLGAFYLGRDPDGETVLYDSRDLVTHGVVLGMTGSGKTGLCIAMLEEAAMDDIPAVIIDPKGDIANLLLAFPDLAPADFEPWVDPDEARRKNLSPSELAKDTATLWKSGLAQWEQGPERIRTFREKVEINVFTPGSTAGIPLSLLGQLTAPSAALLADAEALADRIEGTVASLLSLIGEKAESHDREFVFLSTTLQHAWHRGQSLDLESLLRLLQKPEFEKIGVLDLESFYPASERLKLVLALNALLASPSFSVWRQGPPLDAETLLHAPSGQPRLSILSLAHLNDSERMFVTTLVLQEMIGWMRQQPGTSSLRAMLYMDEVFGFLPPTANPPSKKPLLTLLKQARAHGLGTLLATQNPVDLDYKALSNMGTWFLGRLQTERDQQRVLDGLLSASGSGLNRKELETTLASLPKRNFLLHNVHEPGGPRLFQVRWVMSYLRGPLQKEQIRQLMDPVRHRFEASAPPAPRPAAPPKKTAQTPPASSRPPIASEVEERFAPGTGDITYLPHLLEEARVTYVSRKHRREHSQTLRRLHLFDSSGLEEIEPLPETTPLGEKPVPGAAFAEAPAEATRATTYRDAAQAFADSIYQEKRGTLFYSPLLKTASEINEPEGDFRQRLAHRAREIRDAAAKALKKKYAARAATIEKRLRTAEDRVAREKAEARSSQIQAGLSLVGTLFGALLGGQKKLTGTTLRRGRSSAGSATRAWKQSSDVGRAKEKVDDLENELAALEKELQAEVAKLETTHAPTALELETLSIRPYKKDIQVPTPTLLWIPHAGSHS
ncbi:MAG: DUF87 domain-containing protein [Verrucomicrobiota bacterium]